MEKQKSVYDRARRFLFGAPRDIPDPHVFKHVSLLAFFAWVGLGADGISSSAYGPEETFLALGNHSVLAIFISIVMVLTIFIISGSYTQIIKPFPTGGGGYNVASKLLGEHVGVVSGSALVIDYVLTITISVAAGADALFSFLPLHLAKDFTNIMFCAGQLVFKEERLTDRFLHNQTAFLAQKRLVFDGLPMVVMPIRAL